MEQEEVEVGVDEGLWVRGRRFRHRKLRRAGRVVVEAGRERPRRHVGCGAGCQRSAELGLGLTTSHLDG